MERSVLVSNWRGSAHVIRCSLEDDEALSFRVLLTLEGFGFLRGFDMVLQLSRELGSVAEREAGYTCLNSGEHRKKLAADVNVLFSDCEFWSLSRENGNNIWSVLSKRQLKAFRDTT